MILLNNIVLIVFTVLIVILVLLPPLSRVVCWVVVLIIVAVLVVVVVLLLSIAVSLILVVLAEALETIKSLDFSIKKNSYMKAYHICWVSQNWINRRLDRHQPAACVRCLQVLLQVGVVVKGHPALVAHDVLGLQVDLVDVLRKVRVFAFAVGTFCLDMRLILEGNFKH